MPLPLRPGRLVVLSSALALGGLALPGAAAAAGPQVTVAPQQLAAGGAYRAVSFFDQATKGGGTLQARIVVKNLGVTPARVALDPVDSLTAENLGSAYRPRGLPIHGPTRWTRIARRRVVIAPGQQVPMAIRVDVPRGAKAGDYLTGIGVQVLNQRAKKSTPGGAQVNSEQRYVIGAMVRVPGPRHPRLRFHGASVGYEPGGVTFRLRARNHGNEILRKVQGSATISRGGSRVVVARIGPGTFVTGSGIQYPISAARQHPQAGTVYRVQAVLHYRHGVARLDTLVRFSNSDAQKQQEFGGPPAKGSGGGVPLWAWLLLAGILGGGAAAGLVRRSGRRQRPLAAPAAFDRLESELAEAGAHGRPVSVVVLPDTPGDRQTRARVLKTLAPRLRSTDVVGDRNGHGLMIILPDTSERAAAGQVEDMGRVLSGVEGVPTGARIGMATAAGPTAPAELLERAARDASG
jgi:hypothetical protein